MYLVPHTKTRQLVFALCIRVYGAKQVQNRPHLPTIGGRIRLFGFLRLEMMVWEGQTGEKSENELALAYANKGHVIYL